jgi:transcription factor C subunit 7
LDYSSYIVTNPTSNLFYLRHNTTRLTHPKKFRSNWSVERDTGVYTTPYPSPTGIASDPALSGYGAQQSLQLADHLVTLSPPIERFYSSPFYRCIQTINPTLTKLQEIKPNEVERKIYGDNGVGEWYGTARFDHPSPAKPDLLNKLWPRYDLDYKPTIIPSVNGESIAELHDRTAYALHKIIERCDRDGVKAIIICTHAATIYAVGRALTGRMPEDVSEEDFSTYTCGLSKFNRRSMSATAEKKVAEWGGVGQPIPDTDWRGGNGVQGGWDCEYTGDCSFLEGGEERGWAFSGDESFISAPTDGPGQLDAGTGLGRVVEGKKKTAVDGVKGEPSRL